MTASTISDSKGVVMTEDRIRAECRNRGGYSTPELNETLYLHHFGFTNVGGLEAFTGCTVLYLSHNAVHDLAPLACLSQLRMLYLSHNALQSCASLPCLPELVTLDISSNSLSDLRGVSGEATPKLANLLASHNQLRELDAALSLFGLASLTSLDVSYNQLVDEASVWPALTRLAAVEDGALATCDFSGNAFTRSTRAYRKRLIAVLTRLRFLDGLPIEPAERARAEAFARGGAAEETRVRAELEAREAHDKAERFAYLTDVRKAAAQQRAANGEHATPTAYFAAQTHDLDEDDGPIYVPGQEAPTA